MTVSTYDNLAKWHRQLYCVEPMMEDPFYPAVHELVGDATGQWVCDLACGEGRASRHVADLGARVIGIDISSRLLTMAVEHERAEPRSRAPQRTPDHRPTCSAGHLEGSSRCPGGAMPENSSLTDGEQHRPKT